MYRDSYNLHIMISIHALREEGDLREYGAFVHHLDFYPRPPRGGRQQRILQDAQGPLFLSTPSARRATVGCRFLQRWFVDFYPRPPRGGRLSFRWSCIRRKVISIHALREEGDRHEH